MEKYSLTRCLTFVQPMDAPIDVTSKQEPVGSHLTSFVVRRALRKLSCDVCRASLVTDAATASEDKSYHLLTLRNKGGLVIPSEGTVRVVRAAEWAIRQTSADCIRSQPIKQLEILYIVRKRIGTEDVFLLGEHNSDTIWH